MRKLKKTEKPALEFFADLGVLIIPYAFDYNGTTYWHYETEKEGGAMGHAMLPVGYEAVHLNSDSFFYQKKNIVEKIDLMKELDARVRSLALENRHSVPDNEWLIHPLRQEVYVPNGNLLEAEAEVAVGEFSIQDFIARVTHLTNLWDPMEWKKEGIASPDYRMDFIKYGFGLWKMTRHE